jgi:hypothetical protein
MSSDPNRIADAINNPKFHRGDHVILAKGPSRYSRGMFISSKDDVEWANIRESSGAVSMDPLEWMRSDLERNSRNSLY